MAIRSPICTVVGHVDHGKSSLLDHIRGTAIVKSEAGAITQAIGASLVPAEALQRICGSLLKGKLAIPGLLFIDTPGHAAFTNLRKRGGNLADIAILVVDIREGFMPQTLESIDILRQYRTPFVVAANKIDLIQGWSRKEGGLLKSIAGQQPPVSHVLETKLYEMVAKLSELGFESERFDRVQEYAKQIAIVPVSAASGEGIPELLMVIAGLAQKYLEAGLKVNVEGEAKGIVLEVKEEKGIGKALDCVLYDGTLRVGDTIVVGSMAEPIVARVRALFEPAPLSEMRDRKSKFTSVKEVHAATGVKIAAPGTEDVVAGMPLVSAKDIERAKEEVQKSVEEVLMETNDEGIVLKADSLGSLEALLKLLKEAGIPVKAAGIGPVGKKDIADAAANLEKEPLHAIVLGFNVADSSQDARVKVILSPIIYELMDKYKEWVEQEKKKKEAGVLGTLVQVCKILVLKGYVFRQSNPAIVGVEVLVGTMKSNVPLMTQKGEALSVVKNIQADKETVEQAEKGQQVAVSLPKVTVGRNLNEGDVLYSDIPEQEFRAYKEYKEYLSADQKALLKEIADIKRKDNVVWGI
ncbi:translation initiation factor IF-2 [Candidatus Woesearchaeota archaeon]|nr:translation initiation factor IF-2 [Candidatus Woesearchaeota archaeon]